jgi:putative hydrolase of the HAD superfamily
VLEVAGVRAGEALHVGDTAGADAAGALAAGLRAVHLDRLGDGGPDGVARIASLAELPGFVRSNPR